MPAPLLLLPGLLCDQALWDHQLRHLADLGPMSVADLTRDDTLGAMAERVLEAAPPRFDLAGLSMGGYVAFEILRRAPERVGRLCLIDTSARPDTEEQAARRRGLMELAGRGQFKGVTPRLLPLLVHPDRLADAPLTGTVMAMADRVGAEAFLRQQRAILGRPDSRPGLGAIGAPTLVIVGREDSLTPPEVAAEITAAIPKARLAVIEDCGHLAPLERPQAVTALMRLWREGALPS
ncbi:alpha/beta hydrolase [Elioraea tepida]|uniref:Alpha/beta hydrolase n=1 Tax=Elioraea tepida TaxID=2843330 RepID=A0A975U252_9PROT|nr:alpha/beta fold hydrolase [Elioraea tepida]QXM23988.1 alpha/beta hydrolase [Elioraea tepida]